MKTTRQEMFNGPLATVVLLLAGLAAAALQAAETPAASSATPVLDRTTRFWMLWDAG
jgi:hypothetical protein